MLRKWPLLVSLLLPSFILAKVQWHGHCRDKMACFHFSKLVFFPVNASWHSCHSLHSLVSRIHRHIHITTHTNIQTLYFVYIQSTPTLPVHTFAGTHFQWNTLLCSFYLILPFVECIMLTLTLNKVQLVHHVKKFVCSSVNSTSIILQAWFFVCTT